MADRNAINSADTDSSIERLSFGERINFLLTNRLPRRWTTIFMGWFSRVEIPIVSHLSIAVWRLFADDLRLQEARKSRFTSLHDCFTRELKPGARQIDPDPSVIVSPCDAVVGAHGRVEDGLLYQTKGFPYTLQDLLADQVLVNRYRDGIYVTLRLKSSMYHRFHAPTDCSVSEVNYISGDTWNVNPVALKVVKRLFCKNERAVIDLGLSDPDLYMTLVPVAAILVAGIRLNFLDDALDLRYRGPNRIPCQASFIKGEEMGYFQHGSTIIVFASGNLRLDEGLSEGTTIRVGQALMRKTPYPQSAQ